MCWRHLDAENLVRLFVPLSTAIGIVRVTCHSNRRVRAMRGARAPAPRAAVCERVCTGNFRMSSVHRSGEGGDVVLGRVSFVTRGDVADGADGGEGIPSGMVPRAVARRFGDGIMRMAGMGSLWWGGGMGDMETERDLCSVAM